MKHALVLLLLALLTPLSAVQANDDPLAPPQVNQQGETLVPQPSSERLNAQTAQTEEADRAQATTVQSNSAVDNLLGTTRVTEIRRDNGTPFLIELEHSSGTKQYIQDNDADGLSGSAAQDIEKPAAISSWQIGSW